MATSFETRRKAFGERLRKLREQAGLTGKELAVIVGWNAPKVSKLENGKQTASQEDLMAWLAALNLADDVRQDLLAEFEAIGEEYVTFRQALREGHRARQELVAELETKAHRIRAVDFGVVPGLLQNAEYASHVIQAGAAMHGITRDVADTVRVRMRRQQVLYEPDKTIDILVAEMALVHSVAPANVMAAQMHRLVGTVGIPNVRFGVLPAGRRLPYWPVEGFWIVDQMVMIELLTGERRITDPGQVELYNSLTDQLWAVAAEGDEARTILLEHGQRWTALANPAS